MASVMEDQIRGTAAEGVACHAAVDTVNDLLCRRGVPVVPDDVPCDRNQAEFASDLQRCRAADAVRWAEVADRRADDLLELGAGASQLFASAAGGGAGEVGMSPGVIADEMACLMGTANERVLCGGELTDEEEGCTNVALCEDVQQLRGPAGIGAVVKGECNFVGLFGSDQGTAKELRSRRTRGVGVSSIGQTSNSGHHTGNLKHRHACCYCLRREAADAMIYGYIVRATGAPTQERFPCRSQRSLLVSPGRGPALPAREATRSLPPHG